MQAPELSAYIKKGHLNTATVDSNEWVDILAAINS